MRAKLAVGAAVFLWVTAVAANAQTPPTPIGVIQGSADVPSSLNRFVNFRGVVVGRYEDENTRGDVYYTLFVQDLPEAADGDPATSDGIAVFLGREPRPDLTLGSLVQVGGMVTEFFGLTEIDDDGLVVSAESESVPLPAPVFIDPPADMAEQALYFEALEGMRVAYDGDVIVAGPTHEGCGFAVIGETAAAELPAIRRANDDPVGRVVPVLYPSDLDCDDIPQVKTGDRITGMAGALTYNFDQFKIVIDSAEGLAIEPAAYQPPAPLPAVGPDQIVFASLNAEDYFDVARDTDEEGEPVLTEGELAARQTKMVHFISHILNCPTVIAFQEIEHGHLLAELSAALAAPCGYTYQVSHLDTPDARGIDNALLSDPRRVAIDAVALRQTCSPVPTEISDPSITCTGGEEPLFGRPPLQLDVRIDGVAHTFFVNHFKSKRGGEIETDLERIRQAVYLNGLAAEMLAADPAARIVALGDFNDTDLSPPLALLIDPAQNGRFSNALAAVSPADRYTYNFGGVVEQIDAILLSPALAEEVAWASIIHSNTDFPAGWRFDTSPERLPFRVSDHDVPVVVLGQWPATPTPEPTPTTATVIAAVATPGDRPDDAPTVVAVTEERPATDPAKATPTMPVSQTPSAPSASRPTATWVRPALLIGGSFVLAIGLLVIRFRR